MSELDTLLDRAAMASLLDLASAAAGGAAMGLRDADDRFVAGRSAGTLPEDRYPITHEDRVVGFVVGDAGVASELLVLVARAVELAINGALDQADRVRVANELAIGRRIQRALLPQRFPDVDGWTFAADYEPAREIGGDLFDAFPLRGRTDRFGLVIADVTGKGIPAALLMADVRALLHAAADNANAPADALGRVNRILVKERPTSLFVTVSLLLVETATGQVRYASAGHESPIVARCDGRLDELAADGPILGAFADGQYEERTAHLAPGDALVLYTDGVTETRDTARRFFGEERLRAGIGSACGRAADEIVRTVMNDLRLFRGDAEPFDDLTLLVVERRPT